MPDPIALLSAAESYWIVELPPPFVWNVGAVKFPEVRPKAAMVMPPKISPLPPPLRINTPLPSTSMMPRKSGLPCIVNVPVTTSIPEPPLRLQSPSTNVNLGLLIESLTVVADRGDGSNQRPVAFALSCKLFR